MKIALIDDHKLILDTLRTCLQSDKPEWEVVTFSSFTEFSEVLTMTQRENIDVLLLDLILSDSNGMDILRNLQHQIPTNTKVIILSTINDPQTIRNCIRLGAKGYLAKNTPLEEVYVAIEQVSNNETYLGNTIRKSMLDSIFIEDQVIFHLSNREQQVLENVCSGKTIKEIAFELNLSVHTVQYYHRRVMKKFKVGRTTDLIVFAMQHGLYKPND